MKFFFISITMVMLLQSCGGEIKSDALKKVKQEQLIIDVFALTFHKQLGTCATLPISHRMLSFSPIYLTHNGNDFHVGHMDVILDELSGTYKALYREFPASTNIDQSQFQVELNGQFEVLKATAPLTNDKLILENIGTVIPTITGKTVTFILKLDGDINRVLVDNEASGIVVSRSTSLIDDNCLL